MDTNGNLTASLVTIINVMRQVCDQSSLHFLSSHLLRSSADWPRSTTSPAFIVRQKHQNHLVCNIVKKYKNLQILFASIGVKIVGETLYTVQIKSLHQVGYHNIYSLHNIIFCANTPNTELNTFLQQITDHKHNPIIMSTYQKNTRHDQG